MTIRHIDINFTQRVISRWLKKLKMQNEKLNDTKKPRGLFSLSFCGGFDFDFNRFAALVGSAN